MGEEGLKIKCEGGGERGWGGGRVTSEGLADWLLVLAAAPPGSATVRSRWSRNYLKTIAGAEMDEEKLIYTSISIVLLL